MFSRRGFIKSSAVLGIGSGLVSAADAAITANETEDKQYAQSPIRMLDNGLISFEVRAIYLFYNNLENTLKNYRSANTKMCYPVLIDNQVFVHDRLFLNVSPDYPCLYDSLDFNKQATTFSSYEYYVKNDLKLIVTGKPCPNHSVDVNHDVGGIISISKNYDKKDYL